MKICRFLFILSLLIFPLGQVISFQFSFLPSTIRFHPLDIVVFCFGICWFFSIKKKGGIPFFAKPMTIFFLVAALSLFLNISKLSLFQFLPACLYLLRQGSYFLFSISLCDFFRKNNYPVLKILLGEGLIIAIFSILQYFLFPDARFLKYSGWDDHYFRAIGTFLDPAFNGLLLILAFIICLNFLLNEKEGKNLKNIFIPLIFLVLSIGLSFSRMSYLLLFISTFVSCIYVKKVKFMFLFLIGFILLIIFLPKPSGEGVNLLRESSSWAKIENYKQNLLIFRDNFWEGVGFNALKTEMGRRGFLPSAEWQKSHSGAGSDNSFIFVMATTGIFGFLSYVFLWYVLLKTSIAETKKKQKPEGLILPLSLSCILLSSFFINSLFYPWVMYWSAVLLGKFTAERKV